MVIGFKSKEGQVVLYKNYVVFGSRYSSFILWYFVLVITLITSSIIITRFLSITFIKCAT